MRKMLLIVLSLFSVGFSQDEADLYYGREKNNKFFLKTGVGIGASYGGWFGAGVEAGYSIISINAAFGGVFPNHAKGDGDLSRIKGKPGWQTGLRLYFSPEENRFRPSLAVNFGRAYPYATCYNDSLVEGVTTAITPCLLFDTKFRKNEKLGLTFGIGPTIYTNSAEVNDVIKVLTGNNFTLNLSLIFGINYFIF